MALNLSGEKKGKELEWLWSEGDQHVKTKKKKKKQGARGRLLGLWYRKQNQCSTHGNGKKKKGNVSQPRFTEKHEAGAEVKNRKDGDNSRWDREKLTGPGILRVLIEQGGRGRGKKRSHKVKNWTGKRNEGVKNDRHRPGDPRRPWNLTFYN